MHAYQPPLSPNAQQQPPSHIPPQTVTIKPPALVSFAGVSSQPHTSLPHISGVLSPRASLDLSLHPNEEEVCIVRIRADPGRGHYPEDSLIQDPTAVAVLEHAFQPNTTHPVFHVHMPSRPHSHVPSEANPEDQYCHPATAFSQQAVPGHDQPVLESEQRQPLLHDAQLGQESGAKVVPLWQRWRKLLANPQAVPFFAMSLLMGFGTGILSVYLFLYLDELGELA